MPELPLDSLSPDSNYAVELRHAGLLLRAACLTPVDIVALYTKGGLEAGRPTLEQEKQHRLLPVYMAQIACALAARFATPHEQQADENASLGALEQPVWDGWEYAAGHTLAGAEVQQPVVQPPQKQQKIDKWDASKWTPAWIDLLQAGVKGAEAERAKHELSSSTQPLNISEFFDPALGNRLLKTSKKYVSPIHTSHPSKQAWLKTLPDICIHSVFTATPSSLLQQRAHVCDMLQVASKIH